MFLLTRGFVVGCMEFGLVVGWLGLWVQHFHFAMGWVRLGQSFGGLGWVEEIGPTDNSGIQYKLKTVQYVFGSINICVELKSLKQTAAFLWTVASIGVSSTIHALKSDEVSLVWEWAVPPPLTNLLIFLQVEIK